MVDEPGERTDFEEEGFFDEEAQAPRRRKRWRILGWVGAAIALVLAIAWFNRAAIVDRIISGQFESLGLPGKYKVESAGLGTQVLTNIVIGDPARPDLTVERAEVQIVPTFGLPTVGKVTLVRPRLYGTIMKAKASFGSLDKLLFAKTTKPAGLPDMDLELVDGRARLDTDFGQIGIKVDGRGNLHDGFSGIAAAIAPHLGFGGCQFERATLFGTVTIASARPRFAGPVRLGSLACPAQGLKLANAGITLDARTNQRLDSVDGKFGLSSGALAVQGARAGNLGGSGDFGFKGGDLTARYRLDGNRISAGFADLGELEIEGMVRSHQSFARIDGEGTLSGTGLVRGKALDAAIARLERAGQGTLVASLASHARAGLTREGRGGKISGNYQLRADSGVTTLTVPNAVVRGASGSALLTVSRAQLTAGAAGGLRLSGNFLTGGIGMPQVQGQLERRGDSGASARFTMAEYRAGDTRVTLPLLALSQTRSGEIGFSGRAEISGPFPGGRVDGLKLPLDGSWSSRRGLTAWRRCTPVAFERVTAAALTLDARQVTLCPGPGGAILRSDGRGVHLAAGTRALDLSGRLGSNPIHLTSGPIGFAWPGALTARALAVDLGDPTAPTSFRIAELHGQLGRALSGTFAGGEARLAAVPLDVLNAQGAWRLDGSDLALSSGSFRLEDRQVDDRFRPMIARDAQLQMHGNAITAEVQLREPETDREVVKAVIAHDLASGVGHADLMVPKLVFDAALQPAKLSALTIGVVANTRGAVTGSGRIDWNSAGVTSTGSFSTDGLDFAAAFGPTKGVSGTVEFSDLLGLVTKPNQRLRIAAINPGIEVDDGQVSFQLQPNHVLEVNGANWPFIDGTLELLPTRMVLGAAEVRRYTLRLKGANAAKFVQQLDLGNLAASGVFDGDIPIVFDQDGGHVVGGVLTSRPPGGNVSYVGQLTYKDLSPMANFAFQSLRSLDFKKMEIGLDGNLDGEIVTRIQFDGVSQGKGAKRNFATRAVSGLPLQFNVNIRAPFQALITSFKSMYDAGYIIDPRTLGLVGKDGKPIPTPKSPPKGSTAPQSPDGGLTNDRTNIQPPVSRKRP